MRRVLILGAAGRDFHNFNVFFRRRKDYRVVGFTATQIPGIEGRIYPKELAGPGYPKGIPVYAEDDLERIIEEKKVDLVCFSYSDVSHEHVMHLASRAMAKGCSFILLGPKDTMLRSRRPVIAVTATRTGAGKSPLTEYLAKLLRRRGLRVAIVRHPMPYGDLLKQRVQVFRTLKDLEECTLEEREDFERHIRNGFAVYAGVDYERILRRAEKESDVILWDGGNNDYPFVRPDLYLCVADSKRAGHELSYFPGEVNFRAADVIVVTKDDEEGYRRIRENARRANPRAKVLRVRFEVEPRLDLRGKRVAVVEDGPTSTHGGAEEGVATKVAREGGAIIVPGREFARGRLREVYKRYEHLFNTVPCVGYSEEERRALEETLNSMDVDIVLNGSPLDLKQILNLRKNVVNIRYRVKRNRTLERLIQVFIDEHVKR